MMKRILLSALLLSGCAVFRPVPLTPEQEAILVEETNPPRNEWLHGNCELKEVTQVLSPNRAKLNASQVGANYVEVIYASSPIDLYVAMFSCPQIPPY